MDFVLGVVVTLSFLFIAVGLGVSRGNIIALRLCLRLGIPVHSGKAEKDYRASCSLNKDIKGWLHIPGVCYAPIMSESRGYYVGHNFLKKDNSHGELFLFSNRGTYDFSCISNADVRGIGDLSVIQGKMTIRKTSPRLSQFTLLKKYTNSDLRKHYPDIILIDEYKKRIFTFLFLVDVSLEDNIKVVGTDRCTFIQSMRDISAVDSGLAAENNIIILSGNSGIDTTLVFLVEKQ